MRISTGLFRNKKIIMPGGIRPTQEKVRKAMFDILGDIEGLSFLELYAGSGAVGFEALSRKAAEVVLVEYNRDCQLAIKKNIASLAAKACTLYPGDVDRAIKQLRALGKSFDIVFLDPPYHESLTTPAASCKPVASGCAGGGGAKKTLQTLSACDIVAPYGFVIVQHFKKDNLPDALGDFKLLKRSAYGDTVLSFYRKES